VYRYTSGRSRFQPSHHAQRINQNAVAKAKHVDAIPTSIIDHIEVLQDGTSAVYGSYAIAVGGAEVGNV
jgi:outer membrane receptor protein involved in Fe transport